MQLSKEMGMGIGRTKATDTYSRGDSKRINEGPLSNKARGEFINLLWEIYDWLRTQTVIHPGHFSPVSESSLGQVASVE